MNTGTVNNVSVLPNAQVQWMFPEAGEPPKGSFIASPVINNDKDDDSSLIYIGSTDGTLYALHTGSPAHSAGTPSPTPASKLSTSFNLTIPDAITSTALVAVRDGQDAIFVGGGDSDLHAVIQTGNPQASYWPFLFGEFVSASPTLHVGDGTVYVGALNGLFAGVCPNGIARFGVSAQSIQSSAAIGPDSVVYFGADDRQLRAVGPDGVAKWAFSTSAAIFAAPVIEVQNGTTTVAIYAADRSGQVYKVDANGRSDPTFKPAPVGPISSSPALANHRLYFLSDDDNLYAMNTRDDTVAGTIAGTVAWTTPVPAAKPLASSPAVAVHGSTVVVVVGSRDSNLYFVDDANPTNPTKVALDGPIESSPAIGADGTVYVGTDGGHVYAIQ
jgi:outer membrane protein assembly factor BamB